ncbi:MAG: LPS export ABC transporter periplasmic protein LptC [Gammaproteobacteria bacterium]|nr:LPS export ABC transporter periplasmic protein LptC [Gammaproteobacteria bacterium]
MKRLFTLSIIIAALIFWGSQVWEKQKIISTLESSDPHYIDVFINDFTITAMNEAGEPSYTLRARRMEHYNDNQYARLDQPFIEFRQKDQHWLISARNGEIDDDSQLITLRDDVVLQQQGKENPIRLETQHLEIDTRAQLAKSTETVSIIQKEFNLKSEGMILDNATGQLELLREVEGNYVPSH